MDPETTLMVSRNPVILRGGRCSIMKVDDKGQIMVLETIFFASTVLLSIIFLYQLSPPSVVSDVYTSDLKAIGDDALRNIYNTPVAGKFRITEEFPLGYPKSSLVRYLLENEYGSMVSAIRNLIPSNVMYNIYISNGSRSVFWCNSYGRSDVAIDILPGTDPIIISHCMVPIDPGFLSAPGSVSELVTMFPNYENDDCIYEVLLQMWYI